MFSLDKFYHILHNNLISQFVNGKSIYYYPFGTYQESNILAENNLHKPRSNATEKSFMHCYFIDQEPYYDYTLSIIKKTMLNPDTAVGPRRINILANSEKSDFLDQFAKHNGFYNWYYFFHGFAALDWYKDFRYMTPSSFNQFDKVFICYNHLISKYRSYRLHLVSNLLEKNLVQFGKTSLFLEDSHGTWKQTIQDPDTPLDTRARLKIYQVLNCLDNPLIIDTRTPSGELSAKVNFKDLTSAFFHIVTETVYFFPKLHLTEKIFKPIIAQRPFILVAAPGNLAYLKSYGFRTFDRWIDESYDEETDHYIRIEKITAELERLCKLTPQQLKQMHAEMQDTLEYNFDHFYGNFKNIIVNELVDNFEHVLCQINNGRQPGNHSRYHQRFELSQDYLDQVKKRLKQ